ncbi:Major facilitator superfamily domain general substrate transporter [Penicillium fimorum]|uniref:Major facilitator superfamily domain general substrate transporter n=1 Tax=Penicillium fimorum TaxID=1882269 RepID=A0A9X0C1E4_9EURO|nr:Major facilitator superfamily domain general substrate transporter [Penicillium fimorum]
MDEKKPTTDHDDLPRLPVTCDPTKESNNIIGRRGYWEATPEDARAANSHEHSLGVFAALEAYRMAVVWSLVISMSIIMEGFDTALVGSLYAYPSYAQRFGTLDPSTNTYQIPVKWQSAMGSGPQAGAIIGALLNGYLIQRFGYRSAFTLGVVLMAAFAFVSFFGMTIELQAAGQILCG